MRDSLWICQLSRAGLLLNLGISAYAAAFEGPQNPADEHSPEAHSHHHQEASTDHETVSADHESRLEDPLGLSMSREGSGTAWQPDSTPVYGHHFMAADWMLMLHYSLQVGYIDQGSTRGDSQFSSMNWVMFMAQHALLGGQFTSRVMLSAEPFTTGGKRGYPLLLQTGESVDGVPLHDRQHPHDLFMEVAAKYNHALAGDFALEVYAAPSGEPALGPVAFPHRPSASANPLAPLGHHWQDSTHISFGVVTVGLYTRQLKLEGSWFNGREPDENRYDFDFHPLNSYSGRLSYNPLADLSFQVSYGYLKSPEELEPDISVQRITASGTYNRPLQAGNWATTAVFGHNIPSSGPSTSSALLESNFELSRNTVFGRLEFIQRTGGDLVLPVADAQSVFNAFVLELGYVRDFELGPTTIGFGAVGSANFLSGGLQPFYGSKVPLGGMVFLRLRPGAVAHAGHTH